MSIQQILPNFEYVLKSFVKMGLITREMIVRCDKANEGNLHSRLQKAFMLAADKCGFLAIPEEKIRLKNPIRGGKRNQRQYKADVVFYEDGQRVGICEVISMDMLAHLYPTEELQQIFPSANWLTTATKLIQIAPEIHDLSLFFVVVLPEVAEQTPSYKDFKAITKSSKGIYRIFKPVLHKFCETLGVDDVNSIIVTEKGLRFENKFEKIKF